MALPSAVVEQSTGKVLSYISTKLDDKASRAETIARIEIAVRQLDFVLEKTGKISMTYVSLIRTWKALKRVYVEGINLPNKHNPQQEPYGQVVVRSSSYLQRIANRAVSLSISSLVGLSNEQLSSSVAQILERYADCAEKFVTDVESSCQQLLQRGTFCYSFMRHLLEGKTPFFAWKKGNIKVGCFIWPVILEGRGVEAYLSYWHLDTDRLDKSFGLQLMLRISENTDIIGAAVNCLRSSASLLNPVARKAAEKLTLLHNCKDIVAYLHDDPPWPGSGIRQWYSGMTQIDRPDPLCCQGANGHKPSVNGITLSEQTMFGFPEHIIAFSFQCFIPRIEYSTASVSEETPRNTVIDDRRQQHLEVVFVFAPHTLPPCTYMPDENFRSDMMVNRKEECMYGDLHGSTSETIDAFSLEVFKCLAREQEVTKWEMSWLDRHGQWSRLEKPSSIIATVPTTSRYNTWSAKKRMM